MRMTVQWTVLVAGMLLAACLVPAARAQGLGRPTVTYIRLQTTVAVPDGGSVVVGGYSTLSEGRTEAGVPVLGGVPYLGRGFRNIGYGRRLVSRRVIVKARIIDLREEEYRQTGVRSR
jgi:general secretion pathway protein D